jgi:BMFP domain-containing protein YqiC
MTDSNTSGGTTGGTAGGPGRRGRFFDDLAGVAGGAFSVMAGARAEIEAAVKSQMEILVQKLELVRREDLDAALEVARRAREEASALAVRVAALEAKLGVEGETTVVGDTTAETPKPKEDPMNPASLA